MKRSDRIIAIAGFFAVVAVMAWQVAGRQMDLAGLSFRAIGRLEHSDGYCTATVVARHALLTARHCAPGAEAGALPVTFLAGLDDGEHFAVATPDRVILPDAPADMEDTGADWAIVMVKEPIGDTTGIVPVMDAAELDRHLQDPGFTFVEIGYGRMSSEVTVRRHCTVAALGQDGSIDHVCESIPGDSGGPVLARGDDGRLQIIGVNSSISRQGEDADRWMSHAVDGRAFADAVRNLP